MKQPRGGNEGTTARLWGLLSGRLRCYASGRKLVRKGHYHARLYNVRRDDTGPDKLAFVTARYVVRFVLPGPAEVANDLPRSATAELLRGAAHNSRCQFHDAIPSASAMPKLRIHHVFTSKKLIDVCEIFSFDRVSGGAALIWGVTTNQ